jgi:hypothetical protein
VIQPPDAVNPTASPGNQLQGTAGGFADAGIGELVGGFKAHSISLTMARIFSSTGPRAGCLRPVRAVTMLVTRFSPALLPTTPS